MLLAGVTSLAASVTDCDYTDYPLRPSFCDDWCRVLLRAGCDQEPENCVRTCEQSVVPACLERQATLLRCYEATPPSEFACSGFGFQQIARPQEGVCRPERDALIECAYPEVRLCLDVCRAVEARSADAGSDAAAAPGSVCPSPDIPCDSLCWVAHGELARLRGAGGLDGSAGLDGGSGLGELAGTLLECAASRAQACRSGASVDGGAMNWASVLLECATGLGFDR